MNNLETYIRTNRPDFDVCPPPENSRMRFTEKLKQERRKRLMKVISLSLTTVAAASVAIFLASNHTNVSGTLIQQHKLLADKEMEVTDVVNKNIMQENESILDAIRLITADVIPLEEQLPPELPDKEKVRIIKEYYSQKTMALEQLRSQYIESL